MNEHWFRIRHRDTPPPVLVLDVSAGAAPLWPVFLSTLEGLHELLPKEARPEIAFLGSRERFPFHEFLADAEHLHAVNAGRGRVLSPLLDTFRQDWPAKVVILATRPIVDLADWLHSPQRHRLAVVRTDATIPIAQGVCTEAELVDVESVARLVHQAVASVRISMSGGMPIAWDPAAFRLEQGRLIGESLVECDLGFLSPDESPKPVAELVRQDGSRDRLPLDRIATPEPEPWQTLPSRDLTILDTWRSGRAAHCPQCGNDHAPGIVTCANGGSILPSLTSLACGFVRLRVKMFQAGAQPVREEVLQVKDGMAVVRTLQSATLTVWRYDAERKEWAPTNEPWARFERLPGVDEYVLAMP